MKTAITIFFFFGLYLEVASQESRVTLLFAGDAMQHLPQVQGARNEDGSFAYDSCFSLMKERISAADIAGLNFETTLGEVPYTGYPLFSSPDAFAFSLKDAGFDIFFQANNHALDRRRKGLERTIDLLDSIGVKHTGTFRTEAERLLHYPLMVIKNGIRIAFLNYTYDTNGLPVKEPNKVNVIDTNRIIRDIRHTRLYKPDIIIAQMHWGEEYRTTPSFDQQRLTNFLLSQGVRIIIGHHPHVVQPIVVEKEKNEIQHVVYYSLGNFISNQQRLHTGGGMLAEIVISKKNIGSPVVIEKCGHTLVWVQKRMNNGKIQFSLVPSWEINKQPMGEEDKQKMNKFVEDVESILQQEL
ncbi:MAG: CapA family protein [Porphyromonadaceae bacterium]|nr:CapA family protein [Porphyromonadaceae bacterium]